LINAHPSEIGDAIADAFDLDGLRRLFQSKSGSRLDLLVNTRQPFRNVVYDVVEIALRAGWLDELIEAAYRENPRHARIAEIAEATGLATKVDLQDAKINDPSLSREITPRAAEQVVRQRGLFINAGLWIERVAKLAGQVCRVELGDNLATGFLIGPDMVLTSQHVFASAISGQTSPRLVRMRFDYKVLADGTRAEGVTVGLHSEDWLIDSTPFAQSDIDTTDVLPTMDELDFALVRLERQIGLEPVSQIVGGGILRGWVEVPDLLPNVRPGTGVFMAHYPHGSELQISVDSQGMVGLNANGTRILYRINAAPGSGGAPCFDADVNLFALHQGRRPSKDIPHWKDENPIRQGIPIGAVRARLERTGKLSALDKPSL
jgi:trypsin-like peptidase/effector-associated domain 1 (EAD1)-containing protein